MPRIEISETQRMLLQRTEDLAAEIRQREQALREQARVLTDRADREAKRMLELARDAVREVLAEHGHDPEAVRDLVIETRGPVPYLEWAEVEAEVEVEPEPVAEQGAAAS